MIPFRRPVLMAAPVVALLAGSGALLGAGVLEGPGVSDADAAVTSTIAARAGGSGTAPAARRADAVLATLTVKGRAPKTGYRRAQFGEGWADLDGDRCSTREEILQRDLTRKAFRRSGGCAVVVTGMLRDPYSGTTMGFRRGSTTSSLVQIDHVVALADAWQKGAQRLTPAQRIAFANDPLNLLAVKGTLNQAKGAGDAATWLPPSTAFRCAYVARQVAVKAKYGLWVTVAEHDAARRVLGACPAQPLPTA